MEVGTLQFRNVFAGVRPARLAVLIDEKDEEWQDTCRRIIECLSSTWGGKYSIIVPTDGSKIDPTFWEILEAFDPDYICEYGKTYLDWKIGSPQRYEKQLECELRGEYGDQTPPEGARERFDDALMRTIPYSVNITPELSQELKRRLSPFFSDHRVIQHTFTAHSEPAYPLTALSKILPHSKHPDRIIVTDHVIDGVAPLWVESLLGSTYKEQTERIQACGIDLERLALPNIFRLLTLQLGRGNEPLPDFITASPFQFSMTGLSEYRSLGERTWELPAVVVAGSTLKDFALYFGLSRMRPGVCWLLPDWLDSHKAALAAHPDGPVRRSEHPASQVADALLNELFVGRLKNIDFVSDSIDNVKLGGVIDDLSAISTRGEITIKSRGRVREDVRDLLIHPRVAFNTDNFAMPSTQQVLEDKAAGFFPTPKPKGFSHIVPYDHRWITELRVEGLSYPRHPALGEWLIRHHLLGTEGARTGKDGLCYSCPNPAFFGGDVDTILIRPELRVPQAEAVFKRLAESAGLSCRLSDKGFYSRDTVQKIGGLEYAAALFREPRHFAVLEAFLLDAKAPSAHGLYLASDRRRYLTRQHIETILSDTTEGIALIDKLVGWGLLRRGSVLKCQYCRTADWFSMSELEDEFTCKRCLREQPMQSANYLGRAEPAWDYRLDEIFYLGIVNDMRVPLITLDYLRRKHKSFSYTDELEMWKPDQPRPFIEIDLCCICDGTLTIGEAKTTVRIEGGGGRERRSLNKYRQAADLLGARRFVLATSEVWSTETLANAKAAFEGSNVEVVSAEGKQILSATQK